MDEMHIHSGVATLPAGVVKKETKVIDGDNKEPSFQVVNPFVADKKNQQI